MTFTERILSLTQDKLVPKVVDNVINSSVLTSRLMGNAKPWSGETLRRAIKYTTTGLGGSFSGLDTFSTSTSETTVRLGYDVRAYEQPVVIPGIERAVNATDAQVTDLVKFKLEEAQIEAADSIATLLYSDGTGNGSKDFLGLQAIVDDATSVTTIGGLSRNTYTVLKATRTATGGTLTLAKMATMFSAISAGSTAGHRPTIIVCNETVWDLYEQLLTPTVRETYSMFGYPSVGRTGGANRPAQGMEAVSGFVAISYRGVPLVADEKATSQTMYFLNENYLDWYGLDSKTEGYSRVNLGSSTMDSVYNSSPMSEFHGFNWSGLMQPSNQYGEVGHLVVMGNLVSWQPRRHGRLTGITGV